MYEVNARKKFRMAGGAMALAVVLLAAMFHFGSGAEASESPGSGETPAVLPVTAARTAGTGVPEAETPDGGTEMEHNDLRARWNGEAWEYSDDGGSTWSAIPPDGVRENENGGLTMGQGEGGDTDADVKGWEQEIDALLQSIFSEVDALLDSTMPEGYEQWGSFFRMGDTIARQTEDGSWEYSRDNGETWTDEAPEGFSASQDGARFSFGGDGDVEDFDTEGFWNSLWPGTYSGPDGAGSSSTVSV